MDTPPRARPPAPPPPTTSRPKLRSVVIGLGIVLLLGGLVLADAYYQSYRIYREVRGVASELERAKASLLSGDVPPGDPLRSAAAMASRARTDVSGARFTFRWVGSLPFLRRPVDAIRGGVAASNEEARSALIVRGLLGDLLGQSAIRPSDSSSGAAPPVLQHGRLDLSLVEGVPGRLENLVTHLEAAQRALRAIPPVPFLGRLEDLKERAIATNSEAITLAHRAATVARLIPPLLGSDGARTYFLALQSNAALRGTGGSVLAYGIIRADGGRLSLLRKGSIWDINVPTYLDSSYPPAVAWYVRHNHLSTRIASSLNYSPDFPVVAGSWVSQLARVTGMRVDGVIALDPAAIASALKDSGSIHVPAWPEPIIAATVVNITENLQFRLPLDRQAAFPSQLANAAFRLLTDPPNLSATLRGLGQALADKRMQLWFASPTQERFVRSLGWDGALRRGPGDFLDLAKENRAPNKIDFFGHQRIVYTATVQPDGSVRSEYQVTIRNELPAGTPAYFLAKGADRSGFDKTQLNLYVPGPARLDSISPQSGAAQHKEGSFLVLGGTMSIARGSSQTLVYRYTVPGAVVQVPGGRAYRLVLQHQPLVHPADFTLHLILPTGANIRVPAGWTVRGSVATFHAVLTRDLTLQVAL